MARRRRATKRPINPDPKYGSTYVSSFINRLMTRGKKTTAQKIVYDALEIIKQDGSSDPLEIFNQAIRNATRVGGATYQVPIEVRGERQMALSMRWILRASRARTGQPMAQKLAQELLEASRGQGAAVRRREELHRMAEANRAFVHYRW